MLFIQVKNKHLICICKTTGEYKMNKVIFTDKDGNKHVKDFHHNWWMDNKIGAKKMLNRTPNFVKADVMGMLWGTWDVVATIVQGKK